MRFLIAIVSLFTIMNQSIASAKDGSLVTAVTAPELIQLNKVKPTPADHDLAQKITKFYASYKNRKINSTELKELVKLVNKNTNFAPYATWLNNLNITLTHSKDQKLREHCISLINAKPTSKLNEFFNNQNVAICIGQFIEYQNSHFTKNSNHKLNKDDWRFIRKNIRYLTHSFSRPRFLNLLTTVKRTSPATYQNISHVVTRYFIKHNHVPHIDIITSVEHGPEFTKFIQIKGLDNDSVYSIFYDQLSNLVNNAQKLLTEKKIDEANVQVEYVINYYRLNQDNLPAKKSLDKLISLHKSLIANSQYTYSRKLLSNAMKISYSEDVVFELLWSYIAELNYKGAKEFIEKNKLHTKVASINDSRLIYWIGKSYSQLKNDRYEDIYKTLIETYPLSFYSIVAAKELKESDIPATNKVFHDLMHVNHHQASTNKEALDDDFYASIKRLIMWSKLEYRDFIGIEKNYIFSKVSKDNNHGQTSFVYHVIAEVFNHTNNYLESFKIAYKGLEKRDVNLSGPLLSKIFPRPYEDHVKRMAKDSVDPYLVLSLMRQESSFNPNARSRVGALGLMQLMPTTARSMSRNISKDGILQPHKNIELGTKYLKNLLLKYDYNLVNTLAAYNAGEGRVDSWQDKYFKYDSMMHNIESIPFAETRKYVKLILRNMFFYQLMDESNNIQEAANKSKTVIR